MQRHTTKADAWLQASDESIIGREVGLIAQRGRSLISTTALFILAFYLYDSKRLYRGNGHDDFYYIHGDATEATESQTCASLLPVTLPSTD